MINYFSNTFLFIFGLICACNNTSVKSTAMSSKANALVNESSPYLKQHAYNPVNWLPWSEEAIEIAKKENKLMIVSIGYSACHWCHVMEHESFEDEQVAQVMNDNFICIKVDREERPDVDDVYMTACQLSRGNSCGWPLNAFALPNGQPVWAGTYFPKDQWLSILDQMTTKWKENPQELKEFASHLTEGIANMDALEIQSSSTLNETTLTTAARYISSISDKEKGGRKGAPKFPMPVIYEYLLAYNYYYDDKASLDIVEQTLEHMALGGIYDQIGGGFARYSVDSEWLVPHFEKMLYDNAQLTALYAKTYQVTKDPFYLEIAKSTADFMLNDWLSPEGAIYSAYDADSEGEEGKFYVWTDEEVRGILNNEEYLIAKALYSLSEDGNWEHGNNILHLNSRLKVYAMENDLDQKELLQAISTINSKLLKARSTRIKPGLDDKILGSWNALAATGFVHLYRAEQDRKYLEAAENIIDFIQKNMLDKKGQLSRTYASKGNQINAFLEDYALVIDAMMELYSVNQDGELVRQAKSLTDYTIDHFYNPESKLFYFTDDSNQELVVRKTPINDNVIPGANSIMGRNLNRLYSIFFIDQYKEISDQMLDQLVPTLEKGTSSEYYANWQILYLEKLFPTRQIIIVGPEHKKVAQFFYSQYLPNTVMIASDNGKNLDLIKEYSAEDGETMIYICENGACQLPTSSIDKAMDLLKATKEKL